MWTKTIPERATFRIATEAEINAAREDGGHILSCCTGCDGLNLWQHKGLALNANGSYNGARNIFHLTWEIAECDCPPSALRMVIPMEEGA